MYVIQMTDILDGSSVFKRSADVVCRAVGSESILVPIRQNVANLDFIYTLSPVAAYLWSLFDGTRSVDEIVGALCREYEVEPAAAAADVADLVRDLTAASLLSREA